MENKEIERKYLIKMLPDNLEDYPHDKIIQGYVSTSPVIRIRQKNDAYILTCKSKGLMVRQEFEQNISKEEFDTLKTKIDYNLIYKKRYYIPLDNELTIELDVFEDNLKGLILAEVEFPDTKTCDAFIPPNWFGTDVTKESRYQNNHLCQLDSLVTL